MLDDKVLHDQKLCVACRREAKYLVFCEHTKNLDYFDEMHAVNVVSYLFMVDRPVVNPIN